MLSDWFENIPEQHFDCIISNPPYVARGDLALDESSRRYEPSLALYAHDDGLAAYQVICSEVQRRSSPGSLLLLEHGYEQESALRRVAQKAGLGYVAGYTDLNDLPRALLFTVLG